MSEEWIYLRRARAHYKKRLPNGAKAPSQIKSDASVHRRLFRRDVPEVSPPEGFMNLFMKNPCGEPILLRLNIRTSVKRNACKFLLVLFLFCTRKVHVPFSFKKKKVDKHGYIGVFPYEKKKNHFQVFTKLEAAGKSWIF